MNTNLVLFAAHVFAGFFKDVMTSYNRTKHVNELQNIINQLVNEFDTYIDVEPVSIPLHLEDRATLLVLLDRIFLFPYYSRVLNNKIASMIQYRVDGVPESICDPELARLRTEVVALCKGHVNDKEDVDLILGKDVEQLKVLLDMLGDLDELKQVVDALPEPTPLQVMKLHLLEKMAELKHNLYKNETNAVLLKLQNLDYLEICLHYLPQFQKLTCLNSNFTRMIAEEKREQDKVKRLEDFLKDVNTLENLKSKYISDPATPFKIKDVRALYNLKINDLDELTPECALKSGIDIIKHLVVRSKESRKQEVIHELIYGDTNLYSEKLKFLPPERVKTTQTPVETLNLSQDDVVVSYSNTHEVQVY